MFAVGIKRGTKGAAALNIPEPKLEAPDQVLIKVIEAGIDGTDRSLIEWALVDPPEGDDYLVLGHEMVGRVEAAGESVKDLKAGDIVVPTVRRGCGICPSCFNNQSDMCSTGLFTERGIHKRHGYFTEYVVEEAKYVVKVPEGLEALAVLTEPLSISEKARAEIRHIQTRLPWSCEHPEHRYDRPGWAGCKRALVVGIGPLGFLATGLLRLDEMDTFAVINRPRDNLKARLLEQIGAHYVDGRKPSAAEIIKKTGPWDIVIEASGSSQLAVDLIEGLARNGIFVFTGIPMGKKQVHLDGNELLRQIVRTNQILLGTVNSNRTHFEMALEDLRLMCDRFPGVFEQAVTARYPIREFQEALAARDPDQIKVVFEFGDGQTNTQQKL